MLKFLTAVLVCLLMISLARAAEMSLIKGTFRGVSKEDADAIFAVFHQSLKEIRKEDIDLNMQARETIKFDVLKLGNKYILMASKLVEGTLVHTAKVPVSKIEEADTGASRLAQAILKDKGPRPKVGKILKEEEEKMTTTIKSQRNYIVAFGPAFISEAGSTGSTIYFGMGHAWQVNPKVTLVFSWDNVFSTESGNEASFTNFGLGGNYYFGDDDIAPYVMADFGYGLASVHPSDDNINGFAFGVGAGLTFFRTSNIHLDLHAKFRILTKSGDQGTPSAGILGLGLHF